VETALCLHPSTEWSDEQLVQACLDGNQRAWELLITRYKALICSFPRKYGARPEDAADVFQWVCADLFLALPRLRNHESVRAWICTVAGHRAYHWKRRHVTHALQQSAFEAEATVVAPPSKQLLQEEREQLVRNAVAQLPNQHRAVIEFLFFQEPPLPYHAVAQRLGVAPGSVPFLRARSLRKLERLLGESALTES
jgi:RNA polymerase sigma-70 factor (ECF subfamily)